MSLQVRHPRKDLVGMYKDESLVSERDARDLLWADVALDDPPVAQEGLPRPCLSGTEWVKRFAYHNWGRVCFGLLYGHLRAGQGRVNRMSVMEVNLHTLDVHVSDDRAIHTILSFAFARSRQAVASRLSNEGIHAIPEKKLHDDG